MSSLDLCCPECQGWAAEEYEPRIAALEAELERAHGIMSICSGPCHGPMGDKYIGEVKDLMAELERVNRIVVSQSQQLGNTRSQREHELIEALDSAQADADTQFKLRAQAEAELALRDRMLRLLFDTCYQMSGGPYFGHINGVEGWLTDLRARAEKEAER